MLEESAASSQSLADGLVFLIHQFQDRVHQEGQQVERKEEGSQVLLAVSKVVLDMIALGFEDVIVLVLDLPAGPAVQGNGFNIGLLTSKSVMKAFW